MAANTLHRISTYFNKWEPLLFGLLVVLHLLPVFTISHFATIDGIAHNYNAHLIKQLLFEDANLVSSFHSISPFYVPNSLGHYLLVFLQLIFSTVFAEKVLIAILIIGLAYSQRMLWKEFSINYRFWSYFAFPLIFSLSFFFGFYNYTLAIIFYLFLMAFVLKRGEVLFQSIADYLFVFLSIGFIYFSHSLVFVLALFSIGITTVIIHLSAKQFKHGIQSLLVSALRLILLAAPFIVLFLIYLSNLESSMSEWYYMGFEELFRWLRESRTLNVYDFNQEGIYSIMFSISLAVFLLYSIYALFIKKSKVKNAPLLTALTFLLSYLIFFFTFPEYTNDGGIIIIRIQWLLLVFLIAYLAQFNYPNILRFAALVALAFIHFNQSSYYLEIQKGLSKEIGQYMTMKDAIEPSSVVFPMTKTSWTKSHFCNVLAYEKNTVSLFNYEMENNYFPLRWKEEGAPNIKMGNYHLTAEDCTFLSDNNSNAWVEIDYVLIHQDDARWPQKERWIEELEASFILIKELGKLKLYAKKSPA